MARFRPGFDQSLAQSFVDDIYYGRKNAYFYLGKIDQWGEFVDDQYVVSQCDCDCPNCVNANGTLVSMEFGDSSNPHKDPGDEYFHETTIRNNIVYLHEIGANDIALVTRGYKWTAGTYYTQWDNVKDMINLPDDRPFYVYNSEYQVFKCLYNNKGIRDDGTYEQPPSMYEPSGVNYDVVQTADGYVWKYMYTIPISQRTKFANSQYIPVQRSVQNQFYSRGAIEDIIVVNKGSGYSSEPLTLATVEKPSDPKGTRAEIVLHINPDSGSIDAVSITNRGSGYTKDPVITIQDVTKTGTAKYPGNSAAVLQAHISQGQLDTVSIIDCGINYPADTATTIAISGDGEGATGYPLVINGSVEGVVITNPGTGYTYADVSASCVYDPADIEPATFKTTIGGEINADEQSVVEQLATPGQIYAIELTTGGGDYSSSTTVVVDGDGTGCRAHCEVINGRVAKVVVDECGSGYTRANVSFVDPNRREPNPNPVAQAYAILPPTHGHGYNAIEELNGRTVAIYLAIRSDNMLSNIVQEFRQFGMLLDMRTIITKALTSTTEEIVVFDVTTEPPTTISGNLKPDSIVYIGQTPYRIVKIAGDNFLLQQISSIYRDVDPGNVMVYTDPITSKVYRYQITAVNSKPTIDKHSGVLLYNSNNAPFFMEDNKTFGLKTYIKM